MFFYVVSLAQVASFLFESLFELAESAFALMVVAVVLAKAVDSIL